MREQYVRPPVVAREHRETLLGRWAYRIATGIGLVLLTIALFVLFVKATDATSEDPGFGIGHSPSESQRLLPATAP